jgi:hypothetical protein
VAVARTVGKDMQALVYLLSYSFCLSTNMDDVPVMCYVYICDVILIYYNCLHSNTYPYWGCGNWLVPLISNGVGQCPLLRQVCLDPSPSFTLDKFSV